MQLDLVVEIYFDMRNLPKENLLTIEKMKSGRLCLNLNSYTEWEDFPEYAKKLANKLDANINSKIDSIDIRIWELKIKNEIVRLVFDDFPMLISLESTSKEGDILLSDIKTKLEREVNNTF
ncbi:DUF3630 family protein [Pokkaliibacter sp. MBI-7]|uniref:DUF3630 family protein n=1 Tax=Pokkaliibacter sp. MBI-7 TaxID=3040600 RepID=UPI002448288C|nr:DUF3630 family protein [Pokkaliibacter sp. MBI-7]MDH2433503.1 DUF3630 family protein [Pokkaliibacter sp. MBI-7]